MQPGVPQAVHIVAVTGVPLRADFMVVANADCSSGGVAEVTLTAAPAHGTAQIAPAEGYPTYAANNQRYDCNKKRMPGVETHYIPEKGYVGVDNFTLSYILPNGTPYSRVFTVTVQP